MRKFELICNFLLQALKLRYQSVKFENSNIIKCPLRTMALLAFHGKLYIALEDFKERYRNAARGPGLIKAYLRSLEDSRKVNHIEFFLKDNRTVEFTIDGSRSQDILTEVKQDIYRELCTLKAARKYEQPSRYFPSSPSIPTKVSEEVCREMGMEDQQRLQQSDKSPLKALTIDALEAHDARFATGPCQLRQFGCPVCHRAWWHNVLRSKPVSRCRGGLCGNQRYDALPRSMEFGIGRFLCPKPQCRRRFFGFCEATDSLQCRKCGSFAKPYIHPKWRRRRRNGLNPAARSYQPQQQQQQQQHQQKQQELPNRFKALRLTEEKKPEGVGTESPAAISLAQLGSDTTSPAGVKPAISQSSSLAFELPSDLEQDVDDSDTLSQCSYSSDTSTTSVTSQRSYADVVSQSSRSASPVRPYRPPKQPKITPRPSRRIFNASKVHEPEGGTISTFLTQMNFEEGGEEVDLDYDSGDDEKMGVCKFECSNCSNEYVVHCRMVDTAACRICHQNNRPLSWLSSV